jgi:hypothetical protein
MTIYCQYAGATNLHGAGAALTAIYRKIIDRYFG